MSEASANTAELSESGAAAHLTRGTPPGPVMRMPEDRLLGGLVILSAVLHLVFLLIDDFSWFRAKPPTSDEWIMDADIMTDFDLPPPTKTALPNADKAPEAKVPADLLPQLPKKFAIKEETKPEESIADEKLPDPPKEAKPAETPQKVEDLKLKTDTKNDNMLDQKDALKRAALERLRNEQKLATKTEAPEKDRLATIAEALNDAQKNRAPAFASAAGKGKVKQYFSLLKRVVQANYSLPEAYNLQAANITVAIAITVTESGDLSGLEVAQSSGDPVFDDLTMQAARASAPFPKPPRELAGQAITLVFSPKTM